MKIIIGDNELEIDQLIRQLEIETIKIDGKMAELTLDQMNCDATLAWLRSIKENEFAWSILDRIYQTLNQPFIARI